MQLVPFNPDWSDTGSKLDLKGVYRATNPGDERICHNLPIRRHNDWMRAGLEFVTLATLEDVATVQDELRSRGLDLGEVKRSYLRAGVGPFDIQQYLKEQPEREAKETEQLRARLEHLESKQAKPRYIGTDPITPDQTPERRKPGRPRKAVGEPVA